VEISKNETPTAPVPQSKTLELQVDPNGADVSHSIDPFMRAGRWGTL